MGRISNAACFCLCLLVMCVILCSCSRQEDMPRKTIPTTSSASDPAPDSRIESTHSKGAREEGVIMSGYITAADGTGIPVCTLNTQERDVSGRPLTAESVAYTLVTGEDGSYAVSNLPLNYYTFSIEADGYGW